MMDDCSGQARFSGYDPNGVRRVSSKGRTLSEARTRCMDAAMDYIKSTPRPDVKPLTKWTFRGDFGDHK